MDKIQGISSVIKLVYIPFFIQVCILQPSASFLYSISIITHSAYIITYLVNLIYKKDAVIYILHVISICGSLTIMVTIVWGNYSNIEWTLFSYVAWIALEFCTVVAMEIYDIILYRRKMRATNESNPIDDSLPSYDAAILNSAPAYNPPSPAVEIEMMSVIV